MVLAVWTIVVNGLFGFTSRVEMNTIANERAVYQVLKESVAPGVYVVSPALTEDRRFAAGEPVFGVSYSGFGHEAAGRMMLVDMAIALVTSMLMAGLLSVTSDRVLSRFFKKFLFVVVVGLLLAVSGDLVKFRIGGYPLPSALLLAANYVVSWALAGLAMAWSMRLPAGAVRAAR